MDGWSYERARNLAGQGRRYFKPARELVDQLTIYSLLSPVATNSLTCTQRKILDFVKGSLGGLMPSIPGSGVPSPAVQPMQTGGGHTALLKGRGRTSEGSQ